MKYKTASSLESNRSRTTAFLTVLLSAACGMVLSGCGDFFNTTPTELESRVVLDELSQVRESQHIANPLPEVYRQPPSRVSIADGVKLFYFARHLPVKQLADLTAQQLKLKIAQNPATNQLVVYCADDAQADMAEQYLEMIDVPPVQVNIDCLILERFGDVTMDWATTLFVQNFLGEEITLGEKTGGKTPAFPGAELRETKRKEFGLDVGYWLNRNKDGHKVRTVVDLLVSRGYLKVLLNPQLETINGQKATVTIRDFAPIEKMQTATGGYNDVYNITEYVWVENTLTVTPHVFADGSIGLTTSIKVGSRSKPEGVVQNPIITERSINVEENRIERGKSLIIGGMRKSEKRDVIRGAPFFKDLPIIGVLFSSRDFEEKGTEIIFILTPSISSGSRDHKEVVGEIRTRYADPDIKTGIRETLKDPLGSATYASIVEKEAVQAEMERVNSELLRQQAENRAAAEKQLADGASKEAARLRLEAQKLQAQAEKEMAEAQKMTQQAQAALVFGRHAVVGLNLGQQRRLLGRLVAPPVQLQQFLVQDNPPVLGHARQAQAIRLLLLGRLSQAALDLGQDRIGLGVLRAGFHVLAGLHRRLFIAVLPIQRQSQDAQQPRVARHRWFRQQPAGVLLRLVVVQARQFQLRQVRQNRHLLRRIPQLHAQPFGFTECHVQGSA